MSTTPTVPVPATPTTTDANVGTTYPRERCSHDDGSYRLYLDDADGPRQRTRVTLCGPCGHALEVGEHVLLVSGKVLVDDDEARVAAAQETARSNRRFLAGA